MKLTEKQKQKLVEKLARAYGYWNAPDGDRRKKQETLTKATWLVIRKFGCYSEYRKSLQKFYKKEHK